MNNKPWTYTPSDYQRIADGQADLYANRAKRRRRTPADDVNSAPTAATTNTERDGERP